MRARGFWGVALLAAATFAQAAPEPLRAEHAAWVLDALTRYCLAHHADFPALDRDVLANDPGAAPVSKADIASLIAEADDEPRGWALRRENSLLWLTYSPERSCEVSGRTLDRAALIAHVTGNVQSFKPHSFEFAGLEFTTMRFGRKSPYPGAMMVIVTDAGSNGQFSFRTSFVPAPEVRRILAEFKRQ